MKRQQLTLLLLLFAVFLSSPLFGQDDTAKAVVSVDSALEQSTAVSKQLQMQQDSIRLADSLEALALANQFEQLKEQDVKGKQRLQAKIDSLKAVSEKRKLAIKAQVDSLRASAVGVPVAPFGDTLFNIFSKVGPFSPSDRALSIQNKILRLVKDRDFHTDKLVLIKSEESHDVLVDDMVLFSVSDKDAFWEDQPRGEVAQAHLDTIKTAIDNYFEENSFRNTALRWAYLAISIVVLGLLVWLLGRGVAFAKRKLSAREYKPIAVRKYEFLTSERIQDITLFVLKVTSLVLYLLLFYISLPIIFSIFPSTRGLSGQLFSLILSPLRALGNSLLDFIPNLITIIIIAMVTRYIVRFLKFLSTEVERGKLEVPGFYPDWARPTFNLIKFVLYAFSFIIIFPYLPGSDSPIFQGVSVFLGLLISLGSSSAISNVVAGLVITYMRPYKVGDRVKIGDTVGDVIQKTLLVTRVKTIKNEEITIPNSNILTGHTVNYSVSSQEVGLILHTTVTIGYDVPWKKVHDLLITAAKNAPMIESTPEPFVLQTSLDDFYVSYQLNAFTKTPGKAAVIYSSIHQNIQDGFNAGGVEILSPHYRAARDGNQVTIPADYLPEDYVAPSFRVENTTPKS